MNFYRYKLTAPHRWSIYSDSHVDLGAGSYPRNPFNAQKLIALDILDPGEIGTHTENSNSEFHYFQVYRFKPLPLANDSVCTVSGFDFLEHLSREPRENSNEFIFMMNEVYRILKQGGTALFVTPAYPIQTAFQDPTHTNILTKNTFQYFCGINPLARKLGYGFNGRFELTTQFWAGPFSKVWKKRESFSNGVSIRNRINFFLLRVFEFLTFRFKKTHLVWILKKI